MVNASKKFFWKKWDIWKEDYQKPSENLTSFLLNLLWEEKRAAKNLSPAPFQVAKYVQKFLYFVVHHVTIFDALIQRLKEVPEFFQKLQLAIYASCFMMS